MAKMILKGQRKLTDKRKHLSPSKLENERKLRGIRSRKMLAELIEKKTGESISVSSLRLWDRIGWPLNRYYNLLSVLKMTRRQAEEKLFLSEDEEKTKRRFKGKK